MCECVPAIVRTHFAISSSFVCCEHLFRPLIELLAPRRQTSSALMQRLQQRREEPKTKASKQRGSQRKVAENEFANEKWPLFTERKKCTYICLSLLVC